MLCVVLLPTKDTLKLYAPILGLIRVAMEAKVSFITWSMTIKMLMSQCL